MFGATAVIRIVAILLIVLVIAGGAWYVTGLRAELAVSNENARKMTAAVEQQQAVIQQIQAEQKQIKDINASLSATIKKQNEDLKALNSRFNTRANGEQRNFAEDAATKPAAVERAVNRGTVNAFRCLEIASGSPLTESEINAKTTSEINRECPNLANPNYKPTTGN